MNRIWWIAVAALVFLSTILRNELLLLMAALLGMLGLASFLWAKYCLEALHYRRDFDTTRLFHGDETNMFLEIVNAKPLPLSWLRVDEEFPAMLGVSQELTELEGNPDDEDLHRGRRSLVNVLSMRWYERVRRRYRIRGTKRGAWKIGPAQIRSGDLFGFDIRRKSVPEHAQRILVYPRIVPVTELGLPAQHPFGDHRSSRRLVEDPMRLMGSRDYSQGDNFRFIHWKATARQQKLQSKVFEPSTTRPLAIFLNMQTSPLYHWEQDGDIREYAISAAASIARHTWEEGYAVGLYSNALLIDGSGRQVRIAPQRHASQLVRLLEVMARIDASRRTSIEKLLQTESTRLLYGTTIVVVTATITDKLKSVLLDLRRRGYGVALIALGDATLTTPLRGVQYYHIGSYEEWHEFEKLDLRAE